LFKVLTFIFFFAINFIAMANGCDDLAAKFFLKSKVVEIMSSEEDLVKKIVGQIQSRERQILRTEEEVLAEIKKGRQPLTLFSG